MFRITDILWILAYPIYQIIGTIRHEGSHVIMAVLEGAKVTKFVFWPTVSERGGIIWGRVAYDGQTSWLTTFAPYFCDFLTCAIFFCICITIKRIRRWIWLNLVIIGIFSPLVNSICNYLGAFGSSQNDVAKLCLSFPSYVVHIYFDLTIILYAACLFVVLKYSGCQEYAPTNPKHQLQTDALRR